MIIYVCYSARFSMTTHQNSVPTLTTINFALQFAYMGVSLLGSFLILRWALNRMDPNKSAKEKVRLVYK